MFEEILPSGVAVAASHDDILDVALFPEEEAVLGRAVEKRRREFTTGRACARIALAKLGLPAQPIPAGERGAPRWPPGAVGSITHCDGYRACAAAQSTDFASLGIDAEPDQPLPAGLLGDIALPAEREALRRLGLDLPGIHWDRLLFCMKEAVYKAWFPLAGEWLGFEDAAIEIDPAGGSFSARLLVPGPTVGGRELRGFAGRWLAKERLLLAAIAQRSSTRSGPTLSFR